LNNVLFPTFGLPTIATVKLIFKSFNNQVTRIKQNLASCYLCLDSWFLYLGS